MNIMNDLIFWSLTLFLSFVFAAIHYWIACKRQADKVFWAVMGFFFGPFAFPFIFFSKKKK
jgi:hypothetical protein